MAEPVYGFKDRETAERLKVIAREPIDLTSARRGSSLPSPKGAIVAIFDGSRNGKVYTGHLLNLATGAAGTTAVQWMFWGDRYGADDLVTKNTPVVLTHKCPAYLEYDGDWSPTGGAKYMAVLSPFAMLA